MSEECELCRLDAHDPDFKPTVKETKKPYREFGCDCRSEMEKLLIERLGADSKPHFRDLAMMINEDPYDLFIGWMGLRVSYFPRDKKGNLAKKTKDTWLRFSHCPFCGNKKVEFPKPEQKETA